MSGNNRSLTKFGIDVGPHNMDGLRLLARDGYERVEAFRGRKVMDVWVESIEHRGGRQSLFRDQYVGQAQSRGDRADRERYQRGAAINRQHPYVEVLFSDITESGEALDLGGLVRLPLPPEFIGLGLADRPSASTSPGRWTQRKVPAPCMEREKRAGSPLSGSVASGGD